MMPKGLFDVLACPRCKGNLKYTEDKKSLFCNKCKIKYPIKKDIPVFV